MTTKTFKSTDITKYQKLLTDLKQLHSPKTLSQTHSLEQSTHISQYKDHNKDKDISMLDVNFGVLTLDDICRTESYSQWQLAHHNQVDSLQKKQLKQINNKLFTDNKVLIKQCIRLRKVLTESRFKYEVVGQLEQLNNLFIVNLQYQNQINFLKIQNLELRYRHANNFPSGSTLSETNFITQTLQQLKSQNKNIHNTIISLQNKINKAHQKDIYNPTNTVLKSYQIQDPRPCQCDKQRTINNIKAVYLDKINALQQKIQYLQSTGQKAV